MRYFYARERNFPKKSVSLQQSQGNFSCTRTGGGCIVCMQMTDPAQDQRHNSLVRSSSLSPFAFLVRRVKNRHRRPERSPSSTRARRGIRELNGTPTCAVLLATRYGLTRTAAWKHAMEEAYRWVTVTDSLVLPKLQIFPKSFVVMLSALSVARTVPFVENEATQS